MLVKILISTRCQTRNIISSSKPTKWLRPLNQIMLIFLHYLTLLSLSLFLMFPLCFHLQLYQGLFPIKLGLFHFTKASDKPFPRATRFCPGNFAPKHLHNPSQSLAFDLARNVPAKLKHYVICKSFMSLESVAVNVNFAPVFVCQRVNVVRLVFCHPHVSFLVKPLFTTVNFVCPVTVIMLSLSIFVECFHPCIVVQVSSGSFQLET